MTKHKSKYDESRSVWLTLYGLVGLGLFLTMLLQGADIMLLDPKGVIAGAQRNLAILITAILLLIAVPTLFLFYFFAWKYRETNEKAAYEPQARHGRLFVFSMWAIPMVFMIVLVGIMIPATQRLDPKKPIASDTKPIIIKVIAMRWKWFFIYPDQKIATVNFIQIPVGTPVQFELTADEVPMSSFWIPHLSGQLYAMTGHVNKLNIMADKPGDYPGRTASINGAGFAGMKFIARSSSIEAYDSWVKDVQVTAAKLDSPGYARLVEPSENNQPAYFNLVDTGLYDKVVMKYMGSHASQNTDSDNPQNGTEQE